ncbi:TetR/AcrR family transcriptional regulator [Hyalangium rubrum]|uniref:TetR/AcrR family transcriptional regulator n=1 Tax=Hyalangium rubrum TaxID=3103134 RepID=A0ABU5H0E3_9BACT|nr:TetR/AcrR family transcriptional regulator [Hyalangium sp. s54d21]MDY7226926.1 TetR/AcrR family transcriptional regulator [Hyalangium sp. s54d21]
MKRAEQKTETRRLILEVAKRHFEARGFVDTNIREVAREAGVATGTVLLHFRDKEDLLHAALFEDLEREIEEALGTVPEGTLEERLAHLTRRMFGFYADRPALSRTLLKESLLASPPWAERFAAQVAKVHQRITALADEAAREGELASDASTALLGVAYFSFYYFALIAWVQGGHPDPAALVGRLMRQHLDGLRPAPAPRTRSPQRPTQRKSP